MRALQVSAHNIANVHTSGFKGQRAVAVEGPSSGVRTEITRPNTPGPPLPQEEASLHPAQGPRPTGALNLNVNLDPSGQSAPSFETEVRVVDSRGNRHRINLNFSRDDAGQWTWQAVVDGGQTEGGVEGEAMIIGEGTLGFSPRGQLESQTGGGLSVTFKGASPQNITLGFGSGEAGDGSTGFAGGHRVKGLNHDGQMATPEIRVLGAGTVEGSNVDPLLEAMNRTQALQSYRANIAVVRTADDLTESVLDIIA